MNLARSWVLDRTYMRQVIAIANGKGGVGKTSISTHTAGLAAAAGYRALLIDLDPQGNSAEDLGYTEDPRNDEGEGIKRVINGGLPTLISNVRPRLDVMPGGVHLDDVAGSLAAATRRDRGEAATVMARQLAPYLQGYDLVVLDCPPRHEILQEAALVLAQYVVIPTKTDRSSRFGLAEMARRFELAREFNPELTMLGVVLFGVTKSATKVRQEARDWIQNALGTPEFMLDAVVRHVEGAAFDIREMGKLAFELEAAILGKEEPGAALRISATGLAADYQEVATEILTRVQRLAVA